MYGLIGLYLGNQYIMRQKNVSVELLGICFSFRESRLPISIEMPSVILSLSLDFVIPSWIIIE